MNNLSKMLEFYLSFVGPECPMGKRIHANLYQSELARWGGDIPEYKGRKWPC